MDKVEKCSSPKRVMDFSTEFSPWEIIDYRMQHYDYLVDMRHIHGRGVNPKSKLELDPHILDVNIIEILGAREKHKTTNESCIQKPRKI